jgi:hypothetical protein
MLERTGGVMVPVLGANRMLSPRLWTNPHTAEQHKRRP